MDLVGLFSRLTSAADTSTLVTAISSAFTLTPSSSPLFPLFTLPSLLHRPLAEDAGTDTDSSGELHLLKKALAIALGSTTGSLVTTWGILPSPIENAASQAIASLGVALCIALILWIHEKVENMLGRKEDWASSPLFGLIWATLWLIWTKISPLGRHGIPTADDLDIYPQVLPYVGPVGLDILVGTAGHAISTTFEHSRAKTSNELYLMRRLRHLPSSYGSADESSLSSQSNADSANESSRSSRSDIPLGSPGPRRSSTRPRSESGTFFQDENEHVYKGPRKLLGGLACLLGGLTAFPSPTPHSLDAPVSEMTPLPVGCVIPSQSHPTLNETILALQQLGNRAQLLVLPETALVLRYPEDRADAVSRIQKDVCEQYGTHVMLSVESGGNKGKAKNEVLLVGLHGVNGAYVKTSLFPNTSTDGRRRGPARLTTVIETHRFSAGEETPPTWTLDVARPHGVTKPEWSSVPNFVRPVVFTPLICLDTLHPSLVPLNHPPSFLAIPTASQAALATQVIRHAEVLSSTHGIPSIVCSRGASAAIDETGQVKHRQDGGKGFIVTMAIPCLGEGETRGYTWAEALGPLGVLTALGVVILGAKAGEEWHHEGTQGLLEGAEAGVVKVKQGGKKIKGLLTWGGETGVAPHRAESQPLLDADEDSGRAPRFPSLWPKKRIVDLMSGA